MIDCHSDGKGDKSMFEMGDLGNRVTLIFQHRQSEYWS